MAIATIRVSYESDDRDLYVAIVFGDPNGAAWEDVDAYRNGRLSWIARGIDVLPAVEVLS